MKKITQIICVFILYLFTANTLRADLIITVTDDGGGGTVLGILIGSGIAGDSDDEIISLGTATDTFFADGGLQENGSWAYPAPRLNGLNATRFYLFDRNGVFGLNSTFQIEFGPGLESADLSGLTGSYGVNNVPFTSWIPGEYILQEGASSTFMQGLGTINLSVVPEPSTYAMLFLAALVGIFYHRRNKIQLQS